MRGPPTDKPNLDDVLARDFAELKIGEENINVEPTKTPATQPTQGSTVPQVYNQRIHAIEDRTSIKVKAPQGPGKSGESIPGIFGKTRPARPRHDPGPTTEWVHVGPYEALGPPCVLYGALESTFFGPMGPLGPFDNRGSGLWQYGWTLGPMGAQGPHPDPGPASWEVFAA